MVLFLLLVWPWYVLLQDFIHFRLYSFIYVTAWNECVHSCEFRLLTFISDRLIWHPLCLLLVVFISGLITTRLRSGKIHSVSWLGIVIPLGWLEGFALLIVSSTVGSCDWFQTIIFQRLSNMFNLSKLISS